MCVYTKQYARHGKWGKAIYFADKDPYSHTSYATGPPDNWRQMLLPIGLSDVCFDDEPKKVRPRTDFRSDRVENAQRRWDVCQYKYDSLSGVTGGYISVVFDYILFDSCLRWKSM